jgi:hypothetical protein
VLSLVAFLVGSVKVRHLGQAEDLPQQDLEELELEVALEVLHSSMEAEEEEEEVVEASFSGWVVVVVKAVNVVEYKVYILVSTIYLSSTKGLHRAT